METKAQFISAAYKRGSISATVRNGALAYLARFPNASAPLALSFAKLQANKG